MLLTADDLARMLGLHPVYVRDVVSLKKPRPEGRGEPAWGGDILSTTPRPLPGHRAQRANRYRVTSRMYFCAPCNRA